MDELDLQHFGSIFTFGYTQPHCKYENSADLNETNNKVTIILEIGEKSWVESFIFFRCKNLCKRFPPRLLEKAIEISKNAEMFADETKN